MNNSEKDSNDIEYDIEYIQVPSGTLGLGEVLKKLGKTDCLEKFNNLAPDKQKSIETKTINDICNMINSMSNKNIIEKNINNKNINNNITDIRHNMNRQLSREFSTEIDDEDDRADMMREAIEREARKKRQEARKKREGAEQMEARVMPPEQSRLTTIQEGGLMVGSGKRRKNKYKKSKRSKKKSKKSKTRRR